MLLSLADGIMPTVRYYLVGNRQGCHQLRPAIWRDELDGRQWQRQRRVRIGPGPDDAPAGWISPGHWQYRQLPGHRFGHAAEELSNARYALPAAEGFHRPPPHRHWPNLGELAKAFEALRSQTRGEVVT